MAQRILFAGGGTGGHVTPLLAVADVVRRRFPRAEIRFVGTDHGVEVRMVPRAGYALETVPVMGLKRELHPDLLRFPWVLLKGFFSALKRIRSFHPHILICTGGYASGPAGLVAPLLGIPLVLHEQNSFPGVTVRVLSRFSVQVFLGFAEAGRRTGGQMKQVIGNPVREGLERVAPQNARGRFGLHPNRPTLIVVGGSQGARGINLALISALPALMAANLQILWQTGRLDAKTVASAAAPWPDRIAVKPFIDDMTAAYSSADLALTRAGGMTLAELTHIGLPAVLVPLPTAAENHQEHNALSLVRAGAARMIRQTDLDAAGLAEVILDMLQAPDTLARMAAASRNLSVPDAPDQIVAAMVKHKLLT